MTETVLDPAIPSSTALPQGPQSSAIYELVSYDGYSAVFNDPTDVDYVGGLSGDDGVSGLDSPEVRENAANLVEAHGGVHGPFWFGRRPVTITAQVMGSSVLERNQRLEAVRRASMAMANDATLLWTPDGGVASVLWVRRQQPLRISGSGWVKTVFIPLVAADPRIYSQQEYTATINPSASVSVQNEGDFEAPAVLRINGPGTDPTVTNAGRAIVFSGLTLTAGQYVLVDTSLGTVVDQTGTSRFDTVDVVATTWWSVPPGASTVALVWTSGSTAASTCVVNWRSAWM